MDSKFEICGLRKKINAPGFGGEKTNKPKPGKSLSVWKEPGQVSCPLAPPLPVKTLAYLLSVSCLQLKRLC